eukprot:4031498-Pyramimonas_sp.AAC.1
MRIYPRFLRLIGPLRRPREARLQTADRNPPRFSPAPLYALERPGTDTTTDSGLRVCGARVSGCARLGSPGVRGLGPRVCGARVSGCAGSQHPMSALRREKRSRTIHPQDAELHYHVPYC